MNLSGKQETKATFEKWNTESLISIWLANDRNEYRDEAFSALKEILLCRGVSLSHPGEPVRYRGKHFDPPAAESKQIPSDETLLTVDTCYDVMQAELLQSRLEAEGIPVFLFSLQHVQFNWLFSFAIGGIRVQVRKSDARAARAILGMLKESRLEIAPENENLRCPKCGSGNIRSAKASWRIAFLSFFFLGIPLPFKKYAAICRSCGYTWKTFEKVENKIRQPTADPGDKWACSECGANVAADATKCPKCGAYVSEVKS